MSQTDSIVVSQKTHPQRETLPPVTQLSDSSASSIAEDAPLVLVTGVTGFVATHCALTLWLAGFRVRGTTRSISSKKTQAVQALADSIGVPLHGFQLAECPDLTRSDGWAAAAADCDFCLHVASPYTTEVPKDEDELIRPAIDGTLNVLKVSNRLERNFKSKIRIPAATKSECSRRIHSIF